ncbi:MAG: hypothetical protein OHK0029_05570 [Armatimonadaceae bacterium]
MRLIWFPRCRDPENAGKQAGRGGNRIMGRVYEGAVCNASITNGIVPHWDTVWNCWNSGTPGYP